LIGSIGYLSGDLKQLFEPNSLIWNVGPRVNIPLFAAGKSIFNLRNTKNEVQIARLQYQKTFLKAVSEVENQLSQAHHLKNQAQQITIAEHEQKNAVTILRNQFELGSGNYTELLNGQKELLKLQRLHLQIDLQQVLTQVNLIKALGGGL
jgi:outer membrane protein TolC